MPLFRLLLSFFIVSLMIKPAYSQESSIGESAIISCPIPTYQRVNPAFTTENDVNNLATSNIDTINIVSSKSIIEKNQLATFTGGVTLYNEAQTISADKIEIDRTSTLINAQGNIHFQNDGVDIFASQLTASKAINGTTLKQSSYQLANNPGHGSAENITVTKDGTLSLSGSTFTTCYEEVPDWLMQASEINISASENLGEAYHVRFKLFDVPVLYIPYFSFPVTNERKSGFLYPKINTSDSSGFEIELPYYWNIAPNMDATISPRYMSKRGLQLNTEFRYLTGLQNGSINLEYLYKDNELKENDDARYLARFQHIGTFSDNYRLYLDYTTISDDNYLVDIKSPQYNSNDAYLYQIGELAYFESNWQARIQLQDFEVLGNHKSSYQTVPHIEINNFHDLPFLNGQFNVYSEITRFQTTKRELPEADRYHIELGATFPITRPAWFLNSEFKVFQTSYKQERIATDSKLEKYVSRTLPKVRFHGGINFDRSITFANKGYTQTLEPQAQYLYIPEKDQSNIGVYDTALLQDDYDGLFRGKHFSGLDRIGNANQFSWGVTSRVLNESSTEIFRFSVGRIEYFNNSNIFPNGDQAIDVDQSALASEVYLQLNRQWQFSSDIQYNTNDKVTNKSQSNLNYFFSNNQSIQLNHRYSRNVSGNNIEQVSLLTNFSMNKNWQFVGRVTQDLKQGRSLESYAGFQYESCCWAVRFAYHRHINSNIDDGNFAIENRDEFDQGFMIQFVIKGLGGAQGPINTDEMFNSSIFGYKRPYFLNN